MLDGLGMAETTPGPLIQVVQFVGFLGAFRNAGTLDPMMAGVLGSVVTTWFTFAPCFLWIFLGAPYVEHLRGYRALSGALSTITAAVVGVILNLVLWFFLHVVFGSVTEHHVYGLRLMVPDVATLSLPALMIAAGALLGLLRWHWGMLPTLAAACLAGVVVRFAAGL
jgi:chromate transporter